MKTNRGRIDRTKFQHASKTLLELKSAIASTKSTILSFEKCFKSKNKSPSDDNAPLSMNDNGVNIISSNELEVQENDIGVNITSSSSNELEVQEDQSITIDEPEVRKNIKDIKCSTAKKVPTIGTKSNPNNRKGQSTTANKKSTVDSKNKLNITSVKNLNETIKKNPRTKALTSNKKKSTVKENPKNANSNKVVESTIVVTPLPSVSNSSVNEVVPTKRSASDDSTNSGDILGPILEMLDNRNKLKKSDVDSVVKNNETTQMQQQSMIDSLMDGPSSETNEPLNIPLNLPYSSMSAEEHREFLQIDSMMY